MTFPKSIWFGHSIGRPNTSEGWIGETASEDAGIPTMSLTLRALAVMLLGLPYRLECMQNEGVDEVQYIECPVLFFIPYTICQKSRAEAEALWESLMLLIFCPIDQNVLQNTSVLQLDRYIYIYVYMHRFIPLNPSVVLGFHLRMHDQCLNSAFQHVLDWEAWLRRRCQDWKGPKRMIYYDGFHVLSMSTAKGSLNNTVLWFLEPGVLLPILFFFDIHSFKASSEIGLLQFDFEVAPSFTFKRISPLCFSKWPPSLRTVWYFELGNRSTSGGCNESCLAKSNSYHWWGS